MAWAAKMERLAINERTSAARERVEAERRSWGRPSRLDSRTRDRVVAMKHAGNSVREIAVALKVPKSTVVRVLSRTEATGHPLLGGEIEALRRP